ncbi:PAS/PAC and GAF sensor-containing diguanylate cyclase/phosphodiesterase [Mycobacterium lentiflavum]|uniref:PAS/PAC and GAF sensor-containing diguanylate cyclase/phosphodiesterase n=1 Tax=Mycobacterium lentiflavum TaxID=141349 RepID=A0A0E4CL09_MYCLN|nr:GGDEF domain-containing protein [Mycobacterium lentiflavum]CQD02759.1 PAS/PAC and GAF sensor-containing diguanylate cyclase/phosphodiesterase [Mycobacterium lentiflavum]
MQHESSPLEGIPTLLGLVLRRLGLDTAWLSLFRDGVQVFEVLDGDVEAVGLSPGDQFSLSGSYDVRVIDGRLPAVIPDTSANKTAAVLPMTRQLGVGAYVGVPVVGPGGSALGMVCAVSQAPKPHLADVDLRIITKVADLIGALMESPVDRSPVRADQGEIPRVVAEQNFEVVFQPIYNVSTGQVMAVEVLSRFPCEPFLPDLVFGRAALLGLDIDLQAAVVSRAVSLVPQLPDEVLVAVNISASAVPVMRWDELLTDVDPSRLVLEITEHSAVENYAALDDALEACRAHGIRVAVDDVGAGLSSFSHVLELSPEFVKVDRSITRNIDIDDARQRLAQSIVELAAQIGATVIAEGVESQGELDSVCAVGIQWAQGFYLGRPRSYTEGFADSRVVATPVDQSSAVVDLRGERPFELALTHSPIGMAVVGLDGAFQRTNRAFRNMLGYGRRELANLTVQEITHPDDLDTDRTLLAECLSGRRRTYRVDKRFIAADGRVVWCDHTAVLIQGPESRPRCFVSQIMDVTVERIREADLARQVNTDRLTAIANRSAAGRLLDQLDAADAGYGVLFCDIERFKSFNDQLGHRVGDELLVRVADRMRAAVEGSDFVARWGGDEFLVITDTVDERKLALHAERIAQQVRSPPITLADGSEVAVAITIGSAVRQPGTGQTNDAVLDRADQDMYQRRRSRTDATR